MTSISSYCKVDDLWGFLAEAESINVETIKNGEVVFAMIGESPKVKYLAEKYYDGVYTIEVC